MTIKEAQETVDNWIKEYGVRYFSELTNMACLTEEVGELARIIARKYGDQSFKSVTLATRWPMCYGCYYALPTKQVWTLQKHWHVTLQRKHNATPHATSTTQS